LAAVTADVESVLNDQLECTTRTS